MNIQVSFRYDYFQHGKAHVNSQIMRSYSFFAPTEGPNGVNTKTTSECFGMRNAAYFTIEKATRYLFPWPYLQLMLPPDLHLFHILTDDRCCFHHPVCNIIMRLPGGGVKNTGAVDRLALARFTTAMLIRGYPIMFPMMHLSHKQASTFFRSNSRRWYGGCTSGSDYAVAVAH